MLMPRRLWKSICVVWWDPYNESNIKWKGSNNNKKSTKQPILIDKLQDQVIGLKGMHEEWE
jgi:hypothetical protein